ncbi:MAG: hypothetical protein ACYT04_73665 [Nostoc sp.]
MAKEQNVYIYDLAKAFPPKLLSKLEQQNVEYISKYPDRNDLRYIKK